MALWKICCEGDSPVLAFAAAELAAHLELTEAGRGSGGGMIRLSLCPEQLRGRRDSWCYAVEESGGYFTGSNERSVLLAVYAYLRALGFVFLHPGKGGSFVPEIREREALYRPRREQSPALFHRGVCVEGADSLENVLDFIDWLPKNGYNAFFIQFKKPDIFFERWYEHQFNPLLAPEKKSREELDGMERALTAALEMRGLMIHRVGHGWTAEALGYSSAGWHQVEKRSDDRRYLAAMLDGKRELWLDTPANTNLCYALPEARARLTALVTDYARSHPEADHIHFWLADEYNNVCECPLCAADTVADQYVGILNEIDRALTAEGLDTRIVFLIYQELLYAPLRARIENRERFTLMFAPISRSFETAYPRERREREVTPYQRNKMRLPESVEENLSHYYKWKDIFSGDSFFYDYPLGRAHYGDFGYMKIARTIYEDIRALPALGSDGYMSCQELRCSCPTGFPDFVMGLALTEPDLSLERLREMYFSAAFGEEWQRVTAYLDRLSELSDTDYFNAHGPRVQPEKAEGFLAAARLCRDFLAGLLQCPPRGGDKEQWEVLAFHAGYTAILAEALARLCRGEEERADALYREFCRFVREKEMQFQSRLDVYRIIEVSTKYTGFKRDV